MSAARGKSSIPKKFIMKHSDLVCTKEIGSGAAGEVWLGRHVPTNREVAVKKLTGYEMEREGPFLREVQSLADSQHTFLLEFLGCTDRHPFWIVTKYIKNGSLYNILHSAKPTMELTPTDMTAIAYGISAGMQYIHSKNIIHRDLKPQNILIDDNKMPVIADFGTSRKLDHIMTGLCGTPNYMAPEFIKSEKYDESVDVYSFGMVLWEMLTREVPFGGKIPSQVVYSITIGEEMEIPENAPLPLKSLIEKCWSKNPKDRPSFSQITKAFADGLIMFDGCDLNAFRRKLPKTVVKMPRKNARSNQFNNLPLSLLNRTRANVASVPDLMPGMYSRRNEHIAQLANSYLTSFTSGTEQQIGLSLDFFLAHIDNRELTRVDIWPKFLHLLVNPPEKLTEKTILLSVKFAQNYEIMSQIKQIDNLENYLCPNSFDLFLYVVCFIPQKIDRKLVDKLFRLAEQEKAVILLCKILAMIPSTSDLHVIIVDFFYASVLEMVNFPGFHLALKTLCLENRMTVEMLQAYASSNIPANIVAAYECFFSTEVSDVVLFTLNQILDHTNSENEKLRLCALEYLRRNIGYINSQQFEVVVKALIQCAVTYSPYPAVLLLCHFADSPANRWIFNEIADRWLQIAPEKAPEMMRLFVCVCKEDQVPFMAAKPATSNFLAAVMKYGDYQCFMSVCYILKMKSWGVEFAGKLDECGVVRMMMDKLEEKIRSQDAVVMICRALRAIAHEYYSPEYLKFVPILAKVISEGLPVLREMMKTASSLAGHKTVSETLREANIDLRHK